MDEQLNDLFKIIFETEMEHGKSPDDIIKQLLSEIEVQEIVSKVEVWKTIIYI